MSFFRGNLAMVKARERLSLSCDTVRFDSRGTLSFNGSLVTSFNEVLLASHENIFDFICVASGNCFLE